jgi:hypothetical protein
MTEPCRTPVREPRSVARLGRTFSHNLSAVDLAESLLSLDANQPVAAGAELLRMRNVGVLGVRREGSVFGWIGAADLTGGTVGEHAHAFRAGEVLEETAAFQVVLGALATADHVFVQWLGEVAGVITRRDLQKPPLRMWLFGAITVLDTNLTWAIDQLYPGDSWQSCVTPGRFEKAQALHAERQRRGNICQLVDCLQIKDKADILVQEGDALAMLGLKSRREADRFTRDIEMLRNHLAHAQELEDEHLATAARLATFIDSILGAKLTQRLVEAQLQASVGGPTARELKAASQSR